MATNSAMSTAVVAPMVMRRRRRSALSASVVGAPAVRGDAGGEVADASPGRSDEHTSELQSLMRISYAVFCLKKKNIIYRLMPEKKKIVTIEKNAHSIRHKTYKSS